MSRQLGALGGLAMVLIVLNHSIHMGIEALARMGFEPVSGGGRILLSMLQALGTFAVPIFLFISGSFVAYAATGEPPKLSRKFLISSLRHILIPYILWSIIFYILIFYHGNNQYSLTQYLKQLIVGYPFHFIPLLVFFYLLSPVLVWVGKRFAGVLLALFAIYQIFLLVVLEPGIFGFGLSEWSHYLVLPVISRTMADWGIYFPLGLLFGLNAGNVAQWSEKHEWPLGLMTVGFFALGLLDGFSILNAPWARLVCVLTFVLLIPAIKRHYIPFVRRFEYIGRRSYGLYLTHLIVLDLVLLGIEVLVPDLFLIPILLFSLLFVLGFEIPMMLMDFIARKPTKRVYRYIFG
jgi:peptidoglycan/LPS O-acetylase OafA/YrhL